MLDPAIGYLIVAGIALLFASAAVHKLRDLARFTAVFAAYHVLPDAPARRVAWFIPCLELGVALALCWEPSRRAALIPAITVLIVYAAALAVNLLRGRRDLDCGCGTARSRRPIADWMIWRNLLLASALGIAAVPWSLRPFGVTDLLTVVGGLMVGATLYSAVDRLLGDVVPKAITLRSTS
jgi:hypothetical protein